MKKKRDTPPESHSKTIAGTGKGGGTCRYLFLVALRALDAATNTKTGPVSHLSPVCPVFSAAAVESFLWELGLEAHSSAQRDPLNEDFLDGLSALIRDVERFPALSRVQWITRYLTGKSLLGERIFQDFAVLIDLRNSLIHVKDGEEMIWYIDGSMDTTGTPERLIVSLQQRGLVPDPYRPSWLSAVTTVEIARWACRTAAQTIMALTDMLPDQTAFRSRMKLTANLFEMNLKGDLKP
jgi:hypothetical protein